MDYDKDFEEGYSPTSLGNIYYMHHKSDGEKLIFLHGLSYDTKSWKKLVEVLPDKLDVYLVDLLGHGKSDAPKIDYVISTQVQALHEFISLNNNGNSYLVGNSYGSWVAAYYASLPYQLKGLILEDVAGIKAQSDDFKNLGNYGEKKKDLYDKAMSIVGNKDYVIQSIVENGDVEELDEKNLSRINVRTLLIWGSQDKMVDPKYSKVLKEEIKGSELFFVEGAGHTPHWSHPEDVAKRILEFIGE